MVIKSQYQLQSIQRITDDTELGVIILAFDATVLDTVTLGAAALGITDDVLKRLGNNDNLLDLYN